MRTKRMNLRRGLQGMVLVLTVALLSSCAFAPYNRIIKDDDPYKQESSVKMKQLLRGYSNEMNHRYKCFPHFQAQISYLNFKPKQGNEETFIELAITTSISDKEIAPKLYLNIDNEIIELESEDYVYKEFNQSSATSSTEVVTDTETTKDATTGQDKEVSSTSTYHSTTVNDNAYQLMRHRYLIPEKVIKKLSKARDITYRIYRGDEGIDIEPDRRDRKKIRKYFKTIR